MSNTNIHREINFEEYIVNQLENIGWKVSHNDQMFDADIALCIDDFVSYVTATAPKTIELMQEKNPQNWKRNLADSLVKQLETNGTVYLLRNGINMIGYGNIKCTGGIPDDPRSSTAHMFYDNNILRVMRQVHYQPAGTGNKSLDLVFFVNGIPVATAEVKTELTQTVEDAIIEYQTNRKVIEKVTKRKNPLLAYKRGAVVHFAISEEEIYMCTDLSEDVPKFLPFNLGNKGHKGNPDSPDGDYKTYYFWKQICQKENWLRIFLNFIYEKEDKVEGKNGRMKTVRKQIFPRYHQFNSVLKCIQDVNDNGVGQKYLIQHSAGSGKTATISWLSHELIRLRNENGDKKFSSVIVVTNRISLDKNIKGTIKQLRKMEGLIAMIGGDDLKKEKGAKSTQLSTALINKTAIIVVTLQTFQFAMQEIIDSEELRGCNFAVIIDEAHAGQRGSQNMSMKRALKNASEGITYEDTINNIFSDLQESRKMPANVSFFAFTATPNSQTKTNFGRPGDKVDEKTGEPIPDAFDKYPMRQAIEEGYILDVLPGYISYKAKYTLDESNIPDQAVDARAARRTIAHWESTHPTAIMEKTKIIIDHFMKNIFPLLDGEAKAMIVTDSRVAVVRYYFAIKAYLAAHPEYSSSTINSIKFEVPGDPLVAFSGSVSGKNAIHNFDKEVLTQKEYLNQNPFAMINENIQYSESTMNDIGSKSIENAFDSDKKNKILIVADKFQTGFDQPKLCALYVDKPLSSNIEIVQTFSRLNRNFPGKERVSILDFVNDADKVYEAFRLFDDGAELNGVQNPNIVYEVKDRLDQAGFYYTEDIEKYKQAVVASLTDIKQDKDINRIQIYNSVNNVAERYLSAYNAELSSISMWNNVLKTANNEDDQETITLAKNKIKEVNENIAPLNEFRADLNAFLKDYDFISQYENINDPDLEVFYGFAKLVSKRISHVPVEDIDIKYLVLTEFSIEKKDFTDGDSDAEYYLHPISSNNSVSKEPKQSIKDIISKLNEIFPGAATNTEKARTVNAIVDLVRQKDNMTVKLIQNKSNTKETVLSEGRLQRVLRVSARNLQEASDLTSLARSIGKDPKSWAPLADLVYDLIKADSHINISEIDNAA